MMVFQICYYENPNFITMGFEKLYPKLEFWPVLLIFIIFRVCAFTSSYYVCFLLT